jgi:hypothetical protein
VGFGVDVDGHNIHPRQQIRAKGLQEVSKMYFFIVLLAEERFDVFLILLGFEIVFGHGIDIMSGVHPWPKAFMQASEHKGNKGLIGMID